MDIKVNSNTPEFLRWLKSCQDMCEAYATNNYPNLPKEQILADEGSRYFKISKVGPNSRSAWAFIDRTNGDVLKAASWRAPAKHARGNIFDAMNGMGAMGPYGPAYLR